MENASYQLKSTTKVTNHSPVPEVDTTWTQPIQESNHIPCNFVMVYVELSPTTATMDTTSLPIQEANYDPSKSLMVTTSPALPICMKTATETWSPLRREPRVKKL